MPIVSPRSMEIHVSGPGDANRLYMFSGVYVFNWTHETNDEWEGWVHQPLTISMMAIPDVPTIWEDQVRNHVAHVSLAAWSIAERKRRDCWGFAVDEVDAFFSDRDQSFSDFGLTAQMAYRGCRVNLFRVGFTLNVLAHID